MDEKDKKILNAKMKQWEDKADIAASKVKLAGHKAEEKWHEFTNDVDDTAKHTSNVAKEKTTEVKNTIDEDAQKAQHRLDEARNK